MELSKYIRDLLQEGSVEKVLAKLKTALFDSFELLKELRDKAKIGLIDVEDFQAQKDKLERRIDNLSNRIQYIKKAKEQAPIIDETIQKEAELLMNEFQVEKIVMMMINAIGLVERREQDLQKRLESVEEDLNLIKSFLLSKPTPAQGSVTSPSQMAPISKSKASFSATPATLASESSTLQTIESIASGRPGPPSASAQLTPSSSSEKGPSEDDIAAFRKKLLKPAPKDDRPKSADKPKPVSIRTALLQEMKQYFGSAREAIEKEKEETDETPQAQDTIEKGKEEPSEKLRVKDAIEEGKEELETPTLVEDNTEKGAVEPDKDDKKHEAIKEDQEEPEILIVVDDSET